MKKIVFITVFTWVFLSCASKPGNSLRLDLQLKNYNQSEASLVVEGMYTSLDKLRGCTYLSTHYPVEYKELQLLLLLPIVVENADHPKEYKYCAKTRMFDHRIILDGARTSSEVSCHSVEHTIAHEVLHVIGFQHGASLNTLIIECGLPPREVLTAVDPRRKTW